MRWNDPTEETAERVNSGRDRESGTLKLFGEEAFKRFMEKIGGKVMIRSHEYFPEGKDLKFNGRLATIFSNGSEKSPSSGYKDRVNQALFMEARLDQSKEKFLEKDFQPVLYEEILYEKITEQTLEERKPETKPEEAKSKEEKEKTEAIEVNPQQKEVAKEKKVKTIDWLGKGLKDIEERRIPTQITNKLEKYLKMHGVRRSEIKTMRPMDAWEKAKEIYEKERGVPVGA